jgi:hypothetical protein
MTIGNLNFQFSARGADDVERASNRASSSLRSLENVQESVSSSASSLSTSARSTAATLTTDLTQSAQDAAFGLENAAASAPFLAEEFGRLRSQTGGVRGALTALVSAFKGPAGIIGAITLLVSFRDEITSFFQSFIGGAEEAAEKSEEFKKAVRSNAQALFDELRDNPQKAEQAVSLLNKRIDTLQQRLGEAFAQGATDSIQEISQELQATRNALASVQAQTSDTQETFTALTELGLGPSLTDELIRISQASEDAGEDVKTLSDIAQEATVEQPDLQGAAPDAAGLASFDVSGVQKLNNALSVTELKLRAIDRRLRESIQRTAQRTFSRATGVLSGFIVGLEDAGSAAKALQRTMQRAIQQIIQDLIQAAIRAVALKVAAGVATGGASGAFTGTFNAPTSGSQILSGGGSRIQGGAARVRGGALTIPLETVNRASTIGGDRAGRKGR